MVADEKRKEVAQQILKHGWIEATPENIKAYMDGFEMAVKRSFEETDISAEEYMERLATDELHPIHIVTRRQIAEAATDRKITTDSIKDSGALIQGLKVKKEEKSH